ncbi:MAG: hypothetical protein M0Q91_11915 [Methanoregula sp.]|jgi:lysozyme|nr:hypothetical protein [Methanoregula sp.]
MIARILQQLKIDEGVKLKPYYCSEDKLTIGIGRNLEDRGLDRNEMLYLIYNQQERRNRFPRDIESLDEKTMFLMLVKDMKRFGITVAEAEVLCINDIENCIWQLEKRLQWFKTALVEIKEVLINMCFNMGIKNLMTFKNTLFAMSVGEYKRAADNMLKSKWRKQVKDRAVRLSERVRALE